MNDTELRKLYERQYGPFLHMGPEDKAIWLRFLLLGGVRFAPFVYDLRVGDGVKMPAGSTITAIAAAYALTTKRIDVVWMQGGYSIICEVKKRAGSTAIGQLILYSKLYKQTYPNEPPPRLMLVTDYLEPDMTEALRDLEISYIEVGL